MEELQASLSKQIDISSCDKLGRLDTKLGHEQVRFMSTNLSGFIVCVWAWHIVRKRLGVAY
jgi:hypothetical protein